MNYVLGVHTIEDYEKWKAWFEGGCKDMLEEAGAGKIYVLRNSDDPNEVVVAIEWEDLAKARALLASDELKGHIAGSGITNHEVKFLEAVPELSS